MEGLPIVQGATEFDDEIFGITHILLIKERLYYVSKLYQSLLKTNETMSYLIHLWENMFDKDKGLCV